MADTNTVQLAEEPSRWADDRSLPRTSSVLTIFTIPKPFEGHAAIIQRNAIQSWKRLTIPPDGHPPEIILCGDEPGTAETAREFQVRHMPQLACNEFGTPFVHSAFEQVRQQTDSRLLCYINADIILLSDFAQALHRIEAEQFLLVGQRWDMDLPEPWDFSARFWEEDLRTKMKTDATPHTPWGIDYFVFPRLGSIDRLPPFVVGRPGWDNWMIYHARKRGIPVIDASGSVRVIHQNHDYQHVPMRKGDRWTGPEAKRQIELLRELMDGEDMRFAIVDATHILTDNGLRRANGPRSLRRRWATLAILKPRLRGMVRLLHPLVAVADWIWRSTRGFPRPQAD